MRKKRVISPQVEAEGSEQEAFLALIDTSNDPDVIVLDEEPLLPVIEPIPPPIPSDVDDYLRRQVYTEMYGTETPTNYERTLQALRNRL